jgi:hypothetical protein
MIFAAPTDEGPLEGILRYVGIEHSFAFDVASHTDLQMRSGTAGVTSLGIGTLQIEVAVETGTVLFAWGLHPRARWKIHSIGQPTPAATGARVEASRPLQRGVALAIAPVGSWTTSFDDTTGWVRVAKDEHSVSEQEVLVASGIVLGLTNRKLDSLWLQPIFE